MQRLIEFQSVETLFLKEEFLISVLLIVKSWYLSMSFEVNCSSYLYSGLQEDQSILCS